MRDGLETKYRTGNFSYVGRKKSLDVCGVAIMRAGETLETALRSVVKDSKMGKILIQTNELTHVPELYFLRLPKNLNKHKVFLMDASVATGGVGWLNWV